MRPTPRQRAAAAFAVIDRHHDEQTSVIPHIAYAQLAEAMTELYGPLPDERLVAVRTQLALEDR